MPRNGSGVYSKPAGTTAVANTTIQSATFNGAVDDLAADANTYRPVVAGGTGASNAADARTNLGLGNVDNTSDADKPVSTAQQTALDLKADKATTVSAGTGLTGGGDLSANRTFNVDVGTTANKVVQLDSSARLPAVNGSQLTNLPDSGLLLHRGSRVTGSGSFTTSYSTILSFGSRAVTAANNRLFVRASSDLLPNTNNVTITFGLFFDSEATPRMTREFELMVSTIRYFGLALEMDYTVPDTTARTVFLKVKASLGGGSVANASGYLEEISG